MRMHSEFERHLPMSSIWTRSSSLSPQYDCGLCGYPRCSSFTRAAIVDFVSIDECPILSLPSFHEHKTELTEIISRKTGLRVRTAEELPEGGVLLTRPCKDTDQKVMAELRVHNGVAPGEDLHFGVFDPVLLCDLSECLVSVFEDVKCSRDLGYGRADTGDMSITLLQDGRVNMRRVDNKEQVLKVFYKIERAILGSTMCNCCGNDLISIAAGLVDQLESHPVLQCGSSIKIDCEMLKQKLTSSLFSELYQMPELTSEFDLLANSMIELLDSVSAENLEVPFGIPSDLKCRLISPILETNDKTKEALLLRMLGFEWVLQSALSAIARLDEVVASLPASSIRTANELIRSAAAGKSSTAPSPEDENFFKVFALSQCVKRARESILDWRSE